MSDIERASLLGIDQLIEILQRVNPESPFFKKAAGILDGNLLDGVMLPELLQEDEEEPSSSPLLTIGMVTDGDFDGVYFTVQALNMYHEEVLDDVELLLIDIAPGGRHSSPLKNLMAHVPGGRYVACGHPGGATSRNLVFRQAHGEFVLYIAPRVLIAPDSLKQLLGHLKENRQSGDLLWGSMLHSHGPVDSSCAHGLDASCALVCRRDAWSVMNPRLRGHGGQSGYLEELFRRAGGSVRHLPCLRYVERSAKPVHSGADAGDDAIRNRMIWRHELGLPWDAPAHDDSIAIADRQAERSAALRVDREIRDPFFFFDAIYFISFEGNRDSWNYVAGRFERAGVAERIRHMPAIHTPKAPDVGRILGHRAVIAQARKQGLQNVLVFEGNALLAPDAGDQLRATVDALPGSPWLVLYLGGGGIAGRVGSALGNSPLRAANAALGTSAVAYHQDAFDSILRDIPATPAKIALWLRQWSSLAEYFAHSEALTGRCLIADPPVAMSADDLWTQLRMVQRERP